MRKNKKLLLASVAAMGALALGVGATSTFAWYQASGAVTKTTQSGSGTVAVKDTTEYGGGSLVFVVSQKAESFTTGDLLITNTAGRSYYVSGASNSGNYTEIAGVAGDGDLKFTDRQGTGIFQVKIVTTKGGSTAPTSAVLAQAAGTYTVKAHINNYGKLALAQTTELGTDGNANTPGDDSATTGALAITHNTTTGVTVNIMQIVISDAGAVTYQLYGSNGSLTGAPAAWASVNTAVDASQIYFGIANGSNDGEANNTLAAKYDCSINTIVNDGTNDLGEAV